MPDPMDLRGAVLQHPQAKALHKRDAALAFPLGMSAAAQRYDDTRRCRRRLPGGAARPRGSQRVRVWIGVAADISEEGR